MMEGVESKKFTTKFDNKGKFCIRAGSMTARNKIPIATICSTLLYGKYFSSKREVSVIFDQIRRKVRKMLLNL